MKYDRSVSTSNSALWAGYGDALGFITELADTDGVRWRAGIERITQTIPWKRRVGGRFGAVLNLPAGCYSDDTQLRLAVARAIGSGGHFDIESFAKIELVIWPSYALGGGIASKAASSNLSKRDVNWFSNFYGNNSASYWGSGGNGVAMRIQPHVWSAVDIEDYGSLALNILRNGICTHGHPRALAGAVLHGWWLARTFRERCFPGPSEWEEDVHRLSSVYKWLMQDEMIGTFWAPAWQERYGQRFDEGISTVQEELKSDIDELKSLGPDRVRYREMVNCLGVLDPSHRGSGTKTALLAAALALRFQDAPPQNALIEATNMLGTDTDTIATMAGAMLGALWPEPPSGLLDDKEYILNSSDRLCRIHRGEEVKSFLYPDPGNWSTPKSMLDVLTAKDGELEVAGLGKAVMIDEPVCADSKGNNSRQWVRLNFGQKIFIKHRGLHCLEKESPLKFSKNLLSQDRYEEISTKKRRGSEETKTETVDQKTQEAIRSGFDEKLIGQHLLSFAVEQDGIEKAIAYSAILVKAKRARWQKGQG